MTIRHYLSVPILATAFLVGTVAEAATAPKVDAQPQSTNAVPSAAAVPQSRFDIPTTPDQGRDPFYPQSNRLFATKAAPSTKTASPKVALIFNGLSGTRERPLAMINGHTFGEGEEAVVTTAGGRARVRCIQIRGETAVVEVGGERRELHLPEH